MKIRQILWLALVFSAGQVSAQQQSMTGSEMESFRVFVASEAKKIKTLSTDFVQYKHLDFLSKDIESTGSMYLKTPNTLHWKYLKPFAYSLIFKDSKVLINDQGKKNKIDLGSNKKLEKINAMIVGSISGNLFDDSQFEIAYFKSKNQRWATLNPKSKDLVKYVKQIVLIFNDGQSTVSEVKLVEPSNDYTRIVFKNKQINPKLDDSVFVN